MNPADNLLTDGHNIIFNSTLRSAMVIKKEAETEREREKKGRERQKKERERERELHRCQSQCQCNKPLPSGECLFEAVIGESCRKWRQRNARDPSEYR